jgi:hypothetical protein
MHPHMMIEMKSGILSRRATNIVPTPARVTPPAHSARHDIVRCACHKAKNIAPTASPVMPCTRSNMPGSDTVSTRLDLMLRSQRPIAPELRQEIATVFHDTTTAAGFTGEVAFATTARFPVAPLEALRPPVGIDA